MSKVNSNSSLFLTRHACIPIADSYFVQHETVLFTCSHWVYFDSKSGWCQIIFLATIAQQSRLQYYGLESVTHQWYIQYDQFHQNNQGYFARADTVRVLSIWDRITIHSYQYYNLFFRSLIVAAQNCYQHFLFLKATNVLSNKIVKCDIIYEANASSTGNF